MFKIGDVLKHKEERMAKQPVYWIGDLGPKDDFGDVYDDIMYDGKTQQGPWANMTDRSWRRFGIGMLGTGCGQKYEKQDDGRWLKVEG